MYDNFPRKAAVFCFCMTTIPDKSGHNTIQIKLELDFWLVNIGCFDGHL